MFSSNATQASSANYIEEVFSTYIYTGVGTNTWNNGIDLSTKGGAVWVKCRSQAYDNVLFDTVRGASKQLITNTIGAETTTNGVNAFTTTGFSTGSFNNETSLGGERYASWTFREQPKFFDIVTYTGDGTNRTIAHNLGSVPGCIIVKKTSGADNWFVQHRSLGATKYIALNDPDIAYTNSQLWNNTEPTSTVFTLGTNSGVNQSGSTYVAYLFAHNAGGFGLSSSDNVITCGSYTGNGSTTGPVVTLDYEPQWLLIKSVTDATDWNVVDNMRGFWVGDTSTTSHSPRLRPNQSNAEQASGFVIPNATGFQLYGPNAASSTYNGSGSTYIYIAIRRGPMKVPTTGTTVFSPVAFSGTGSSATVSAGFPPDSAWLKQRDGTAWWQQYDRLRGNDTILASNSTNAETTNGGGGAYFTNAQNGITLNGTDTGNNGAGNTYGDFFFRRAPGFFDEVCYTGTGSNLTVNHNLGVVPELMIMKARSNAAWWPVYCANVSLSGANVLGLNYSDAAFASSQFNGAPTSTTFQLVNSGSVNTAGQTQVAYLFATCAGVSKVGSYTGTGALQTVNCGFAAGARFVMIKRTDSTGDWYVYDSARGISSGSDPYLLINSTAAETTGTNYVDTDTTGFKVTAAAPAGLNANGGTYIFLAIA